MVTRKDELAALKPRRKPLGRKDILTVHGIEPDPNFVRRWINDVDDRLPRALEAGYVFVDRHGQLVGDESIDEARREGTLMSKIVGPNLTAFLMKIPKEWYDEDQARKQNEIDLQEAEMKKELTDRLQGRYGNVNIESSR